MNVNFETFVPKFNEIIARGLSSGLGNRDGQMCIEAAVCAALDLPHGDNPPCVASSVRNFKIALNDSVWSSPEARAKGLRKLGIAQVGSKGVINDIEFLTKLSDKLIRKLIPKLFREIFPNNESCLNAANRCENEGTDAADAADAAYAARAAAYAADAADAAAYAKKDEYLTYVADLALEVLTELDSPGVKYI